jgi:site-specific DNA recombinase
MVCACMKNAAIYCRVSAEDQEREGTSLLSQRDACLLKAKELSYEVPGDNVLMETSSGLTLDRPKMGELREWVHKKKIEAVIAYTLDRVSRDPVHFIIIQDELEKHGTELILVTETLDSSDMGKLIMHIKGYAAKLEAQKILERTTRGRQQRVKDGKLPTGRGVLYGYDYDKESGMNIANGCLDTVRMVGTWILDEGIFLNEVCRRLMDMGIPAPKGGLRWSRGTVGRIFHNPTYAGKTYVYRTKTIDNKRVLNSNDNLVELDGVIDKAAFTWEEWQRIQKQLEKNRELSPRNQKLNYLLRSRVYCKKCGRKYYGIPYHGKPYYRCSGRVKLLSDLNCSNIAFNAFQLENAVWHEIEKVLTNPELILAELQKQRESGANVVHFEQQIATNKKRLETLDEADTRHIRLYGTGLWTYEKLEKETMRIRAEQRNIKQSIIETEKLITNTKELELNFVAIRELCESVSKNLSQFNFSDKQLALEALGIKVWIDGDMVTIEGTLPVTEANTVSLQS